MLQRARAALPRNATITAALDQLEAVATAIVESGAQCSLDLADLPGLDYHTGLVFVAYLQGTTHVSSPAAAATTASAKRSPGQCPRTAGDRFLVR